jgi:DNA-binding response OmpR family regulator
MHWIQGTAPTGTLRVVKVLGCIRDLMFSTRVRDAARQHGHECQIVSRAADVPDHLAGADLVLIDLMVPGGGALEAVAAAAAAGVPVVAYGEHVQADVLQAGRDAGADEVFTRSEFTRRLAALLAAEAAQP